MKRTLIAVAALALSSACGGSGPETATTPTLPPTQSEAAAERAKAQPTPKPEPTPAKPESAPLSRDQVIDRAVAMFIGAAEVVNAAAGDCPKMAAELNAWLDANDAERNAVMDELAKIPEEQRVGKFNEKMAAHRKVLEAMQNSVGGCVEDEAFAEAWQRLDG